MDAIRDWYLDNWRIVTLCAGAFAVILGTVTAIVKSLKPPKEPEAKVDIRVGDKE